MNFMLIFIITSCSQVFIYRITALHSGTLSAKILANHTLDFMLIRPYCKNCLYKKTMFSLVKTFVTCRLSIILEFFFSFAFKLCATNNNIA